MNITSYPLTAENVIEEKRKMIDFFVSYTGKDKAWAEWIAWQQAWDFRPGGNFVLDMQRAAEQAERTIAILSQNYLDALYTQPEWAAAFAQDPTGTKKTFLPVRVQECELKGLLSQIVYIDLVGKSEGEAREEVLNGLAIGRVKPITAPEFPGSKPAVPHTQSEKPTFPPQKFSSSNENMAEPSPSDVSKSQLSGLISTPKSSIHPSSAQIDLPSPQEKARLWQRWEDLQNPLKTYNRRIVALQKDIARTLDGEQQVILEEKLADARQARQKILEEIKEIEQQMGDRQ